MKNKHIALFTIGILAALNASAALPTSGVWPATTISADETVVLEGDIDLQGIITISAGATLTVMIAESVTGDVTIKRSANVNFFDVSGTLNIQGTNATKRVVLDGNYDVSTSSGNTGYGIYGKNAGTKITLDYSVLQNIYRSSTDGNYIGSAVLMTSSCGASSSFSMTNSMVKNCVFAGSSTGGIMSFSSSQTGNTNTYPVTFNNCSFKDNNVTSSTLESGGVIYCASNVSIVGTITNCNFESNLANKRGAAIHWRSNYPGVTVTGSTFTSNESSYQGGAIAAEGKLDVTSCTFSSNSAPYEGGAIYCYGSCTVDDCDFIENSSARGGAIFEYTKMAAEITIKGGSEFLRNKAVPSSESAETQGGAVRILKNADGNCSLVMSGNCVFDGNTSTAGYGGAVYFNRNNSSNQCKADISNVIVRNNSSSLDGGGFYFCGSDFNDISITNTTITSNEAVDGAGLFTVCGTTITGGSFSANIATGNGGAVYNKKSLTVNGSSFSSNTAVNGGAVYTYTSAKATVDIKGASSFSGNTASTDGGAIYFAKENGYTASFTIGGTTTLTGNSATEGRGGAVCMLCNRMGDSQTCNVSFSGVTFGGASDALGNKSKLDGGALFIGGTVNTNTIALTNTTFSHNMSTSSNGGAVFLSRGNSITVNGSTFDSNSAVNGGAIAAKTENSITMSIYGDCNISGNSASNDGGAIYFNKNNSATAKLTIGSSTAELNKANIYSNTATSGNGGAIAAFRTNTSNTFEVNFLGGNIKSNNALNGNGGGAYIVAGVSGNRSVINLTGSFVIGGDSASDANKAVDGAGIYLAYATPTFSNGVIKNNIATGNGGGVYTLGSEVNFTENSGCFTQICNNSAVNGGGAYLSECYKNRIYHTEINDNTATGNGGGLYVNLCSDFTDFNLSTSKKPTIISGNRAVDGAGMYLNSATNSYLSHAEIKSNSASRNGGGIYASGGNQSFEEETYYMKITDNTALNGAGLYLTGAAKCTVSYVCASGNHAIATAPISTAWKSIPKGSEIIQGIGGGVYVATGTSESARTTLTFSNANTFGVYNNLADNGAAELFADGAYTNITLPTSKEIKNMTLLGATYKAGGWYEDYITNDEHYHDEGTAKGATAGRYPDVISPILAGSVNVNDLYVCLTLGYPRSILIKATGLKTGDNAVFTITKDGEFTPYESFALTGTSDDGTAEISRLVKNLESGSWTVKETGWGWSYSADPSSRSVTHELTDSDTPVEYVFSFTKSSTINSTEAKAKNEIGNNGFRITIAVTPRGNEEGGIIGL